MLEDLHALDPKPWTLNPKSVNLKPYILFGDTIILGL